MREKAKVSCAVLTMCAALFAVAASANAEQGERSLRYPPAVKFRSCTALKTIDVVNSTDASTTTSIIYTDVPGAFVNLRTKKPGCVLVTFSAPTYSPQTFTLVQIVLDGATGCLPSTATFANAFAGRSTEDEYANSMTDLCPDVAPGKHVIRTQSRLTNEGQSRFDGFTMTVAHP
ncbi:MAG: hypothetical protein JO056_09360 [Alphaproteobacteria bacterium]|nr:hypothetical protein [Alphaproteobacteria bacterium]